MRIVVGLGNPGEQYKNTRHNVAWLAIDNFLGDVPWRLDKKFNSFIYESGNVIFVKPLTFMNNSGMAVQKILNFYKLLPKNFGLIKRKDADLNGILTVIHDDLDLDFGVYKVATDSGSAGHNGVKSIINYLKTQKFTRWRIGIKNGLLKNHLPPDKFVLTAFNQEEKNRLPQIFSELKNKYLTDIKSS